MAEHGHGPKRPAKPGQSLPKPSPTQDAHDTRSQQLSPRAAELARAVRLITRICRIAGDPQFIKRAHRYLTRRGVRAAIVQHDSSLLFEWLMESLSFRGIANRVATYYMQLHGRVCAEQVAHGLDQSPTCPKLQSYWHFAGCGYRKAARRCAEPSHFPRCPLPSHDLRNGGLNQTAYSLFLFIRDIADGDLVAWIDARLTAAERALPADRPTAFRSALLPPFGEICGISSKVASMTLSILLLAADRDRPLWIEAGGVLIAVDTLVHNFLHRTGLIAGLGAPHPYGARCYLPGGCAEIIDRLAAQIDVRRFNPEFPAYFPRFVQLAIWRFCASDEFDECNGNQIDDRASCSRRECPVFRLCAHVPLKPERRQSRD